MKRKEVDGVGEITAAYNDNDQYIGDEEFAKVLQGKGIEPEVNKPSHSVCSIGFCEKENKWYGWSHRVMYGFTIGSEVKKGDCAYSSKDKDDFLEYMILFWTDNDDEGCNNVTAKHTDDGVEVSWVYSDKIPNKKLRNKISSVTTGYPESYGNGEWVAKTMDDAKKMACDFAESVS